MRVGYSSRIPVSVLMMAHAIGAMRGSVDRRLYCGATTSLEIFIVGVGEKTEMSLLSGGMICGVVEMFLLGVTLVCCTGWWLCCVDVA